MGKSVLLAGCWLFPILRFYQLMGAQGLFGHEQFVQLRKDAQVVCPERWQHRGCIYFPQPRYHLAIIHKQDDVTGFRLSGWAVAGCSSWCSL